MEWARNPLRPVELHHKRCKNRLSGCTIVGANPPKSLILKIDSERQAVEK
jgi:hypothetical protein